LVDGGAAKVYAGARDPGTISDPALTPVRLDVTDRAQVAAAAELCADVDLVINNAGVLAATPVLEESFESARHELEVNYFGTLAVAQAFAPVLAANGGGALVNMLSVMSWLTLPRAGTYAASKAAAWSATNALRVMLRGQGTLVVGVHAGYIDTDMTAQLDVPKLTTAEVAAATLDGIQAGAEEVLVDDFTRQVKAAVPEDLRLLYPGIQETYDAGVKAGAA
jgi:NAD(P)-dependent dehydrogenase (short-subunit alcohol dehydrogenase family)